MRSLNSTASGRWGNRLLGVFVTLATLTLLVGLASLAFGRNSVSDQLPPPDQAAEEGIEHVVEGSGRIVQSESVAGVPEATIDFVTYETSQGRCFDVVVVFRGEKGSGGGCGGEGTSLTESGVGVTGVRVGNQHFTVVSGLLDKMPGARFVEADLPSGNTVRMAISENGIFHWAFPSDEVEDPSFLPVEFRLLSASGETLETLSGPSADVYEHDGLPVEHVEGEPGLSG